jgi:hypothetical protein
MADRFWMGPPPAACDTCDTPITTKFYDAATVMGPWANMCPSCFTLGPGRGKLGTGLGQEYTKVAGSCEFKKTGG